MKAGPAQWASDLNQTVAPPSAAIVILRVSSNVPFIADGTSHDNFIEFADVADNKRIAAAEIGMRNDEPATTEKAIATAIMCFISAPLP